MNKNWKIQTPETTAAINIGAHSRSGKRRSYGTTIASAKAPDFASAIDLSLDDRFIDEGERLRLTSVSQSTWYRWIHLGLAPEKYLIGPNTARNLLSEVRAWMEGRRSGWQNARLTNPQARKRLSA